MDAPALGGGQKASRGEGAGSSGHDRLAARNSNSVVAMQRGVVLPAVHKADLVRLEAGEDATETSAAATPPAKRRGLNPFLTFRNEFFKAAKESAGRKLNADELLALGRQAKDRWRGIDKAAQADLYQSWREQPINVKTAPRAPYVPIWDGGTRGSPISEAELAEHHKDNGWPTDKEVFDERAYHIEPTSSVDFAASQGYDLFGCTRSALTVC